ncbi:MAG: nucleotidyltransferase family protein [Microthrixaceae bacterium]
MRASDPLTSLFPALGAATAATLLLDFAPTVSPPTGDWREELPHIVDQRLAATALRLIRERALPVDPDVLTALQESAFGWAVHMQTITVAGAEALDLLERERIPFVVTKGPTIARLYASVMERPFIDLDVLVHPNAFGRAVRALKAEGYFEPTETQMPWPFLDRHGREAVNLVHPRGGSIDLHHHLPPWRWSGSLAQLVLDGPDHMTAFGVGMPAASIEHDLLIAALHVVSDKNQPGRSLLPWRDLLVLARACDVDRVVEQAASAGLTNWLRSILGALPAPAQPLELMTALSAGSGGGSPQSDRHLRHLLRGHGGGHIFFSQPLRLPALNAAGWLAGMALPSPSFLRQQMPSAPHPYRAWYATGLRSMVSGLRRERTGK